MTINSKMFRPMNQEEIDKTAYHHGKAQADICERLTNMMIQNNQTIADREMNGLAKEGTEGLLENNAKMRRAIGSLTGLYSMDPEKANKTADGDDGRA